MGNTLHMECLWVCFSKVLLNDLDKLKDHWNSHKISKSPYSSVHGVPDVMYFLLEYQTRRMSSFCTRTTSRGYGSTLPE